jgi:putative ABC transport system permease protein
MQLGSLIQISLLQAFQELKTNKLRTFLSLLGVTIGIFCIIAVLTLVDSLKANIEKSMSGLGNDILYINKKPWVPEETEYKWWEYLQRKPMTERELQAISQVPGVQHATITYTTGITAKYHDIELSGVSGYAVAQYFDQIQQIEISDGRYLSNSEIAGGTPSCVLGSEISNYFFGSGVSPIGKSISFFGKKFVVVGVLKKMGRNMAGLDFDNAVFYPYKIAKTVRNLAAIDWSTDPLIMVKAAENQDIHHLKDEIEGKLRTLRKVAPGAKNDFAINQLSQISSRIDMLFGTVNVVGWVIAGFSLIVGGFGIANIMFVSVKERIKIIGLKKAIGARPWSIMMEFLTESVTLCLIGGILGMLLVILLSLAVNYGTEFPITFSIQNFLLGLGISTLTGILSGIIPARSASKLDPVVAIRS